MWTPSGVSGLYQEFIETIYIFDLIILQEAYLPTNHMKYYELEISTYTYLLAGRGPMLHMAEMSPQF
jgi:hypothetical protein